MTSYLFIFGRTPPLSLLELQTLLPNVSQVAPGIAQSDQMVSIDKLGGTVKIAEVLGHMRSITATEFTPFIRSGATFGISVYGGRKIEQRLLRDIKEQANAARFIEPREGNVLSSVVVSKNKATEFIVVGDILGKTIAIQDFEEWRLRDYGRPFAEPSSGMLPPKVARMVVNIASSGSAKSGSGLKVPQGLTPVLLDPFCGMGTILGEALLTGWNVLGSDQSAITIDKARANVDWLKKNYQYINALTASLFSCDATHVSEKLNSESIEAIVTEPFLGPRVIKPPVANIVKGLEKLYIGCLRDWYKILKPGGRIVMAIPSFHLGKNTYSVKKVIDSCETLGYTTVAGPIEYSRPQAIVRREFYVLKKS